MSALLTLSGCGDRHSENPPGPARPIPAPANEVPAPGSDQDPALDPTTIEPAPGWPFTHSPNGDEDDGSAWWLLLGFAAVKPAEEIESVEKLCGKFYDFDGVIKLVQTRTRGRRTYPVQFLAAKYKFDTHYCFKGVFKRYRVFGGPDVTVFEIESWADGFSNHANARDADGLPPMPRKKKTCDEDLLEMTEDPSPFY